MTAVTTHTTIRHRLLALAGLTTLMLSLLIGFGAPRAAAASCNPYPDVSSSNVHCANITWLQGQGITKPADGRYHPQSAVTRGSMAAFLFRLTHPGQPSPTCTKKPFPDVAADSTFCGYITWAVNNGVTVGYPDGTFKPSNGVTRGAMAAFLQRIAVGSPAAACSSQPFADVAADSTFCKPINWMKANHLTYGVGDGTYYATADIVNRQSMASFLHRISDFQAENGLAGRYFTAAEIVQYDTDAGYYGVVFVDGTWAYWGRPKHGLPTCTKVTGSVDLANAHEHWGCVKYTYRPSDGTVTLGSAKGTYHRQSDRLTFGRADDSLTFYPVNIPKPGARFAANLEHIKVAGVCSLWGYCSTTTTGLALGKDGKFVLSKSSLLSSITPGVGGTWAGDFPPDEHGTYRIKSGARMVLTFADGSTETLTVAVHLDQQGKPDADDSSGEGGIVLGTDYFWSADY